MKRTERRGQEPRGADRKPYGFRSRAESQLQNFHPLARSYFLSPLSTLTPSRCGVQSNVFIGPIMTAERGAVSPPKACTICRYISMNTGGIFSSRYSTMTLITLFNWTSASPSRIIKTVPEDHYSSHSRET